jgi:hypothetical protein
VTVDGEVVLSVSDRTTLLRGVCNQRLKFEIEYGLKRGTTNNTYVIKVGTFAPPSVCLAFAWLRTSCFLVTGFRVLLCGCQTRTKYPSLHAEYDKLFRF